MLPVFSQVLSQKARMLKKEKYLSLLSITVCSLGQSYQVGVQTSNSSMAGESVKNVLPC